MPPNLNQVTSSWCKSYEHVYSQSFSIALLIFGIDAQALNSSLSLTLPHFTLSNCLSEFVNVYPVTDIYHNSKKIYPEKFNSALYIDLLLEYIVVTRHK